MIRSKTSAVVEEAYAGGSQIWGIRGEEISLGQKVEHEVGEDAQQ